VFTACGAMILRPQHQLPAGSDLLTLQTQFLTPIFPALRYLYFVGAFLAVFGTLYGTIEVAPAIARELAFAFDPAFARARDRLIRVGSILWVCGAALAVLIISVTRKGTPPALIAILTPANLFTGVLACGCVCLLAIWADRKLPPRLRMPLPLVGLNVAGGAGFIVLGLKGYWDYNARFSWMIFAATIVTGFIGAASFRGRRQGLANSRPRRVED
jgi:hypothetical protein